MSKYRSSLLMLAAGLLVGAGIGLVLIFGLGLDGSIWEKLSLKSNSIFLVPPPAKPKTAWNFQLTDLAGNTVDMKDLRGRPVLINFWATWCYPCRNEMPLIEKYYQQYSNDLVVLAINDNESKGDIQAYVNELGLTFPTLLDPRGYVNDLYQVRGYPTTFFIDAEGQIQAEHIGEMNEKQLAAYLKRIGVGND